MPPLEACSYTTGYIHNKWLWTDREGWFGILHVFYILGYGDLRINTSSGGKHSGRLEYEDENGKWGTVCSYGFDGNAADVACKQLGSVNQIKCNNINSASISPRLSSNTQTSDHSGMSLHLLLSSISLIVDPKLILRLYSVRIQHWRSTKL